MTRKHFLKDSYRPLLELSLTDSEESAGVCIMGGVPSSLPIEFLLVYEDAQGFKDGNCAVEFTQHNLVFFVEFVHLVHDVFLKSPH
jgi:hypothetical protein